MASVFMCTRLNSTTFFLVENDQYGEHPFIYARLFTECDLLVLSDTGCGTLLPTASEHSAERHSALRTFLETVPIPQWGNRPLNPRKPDGTPSLKYLIVCTHCHYDHILGIPGFLDADPIILASAHDKSFIEDDLPESSLCEYLNIPTPQYTVSYWANDREQISLSGKDLGIEILHTPGHTPDELAWYDASERHLYVGDSFYERVAKDKAYAQAIVFPPQGDMIEYMKSLKKLVKFVDEKNSESSKSRVKIGCGHVTSDIDGAELLTAVQGYFDSVLDGKIPVKQSVERGGYIFDWWQEEGEPRFSLYAPRYLVDDARRDRGRVKSNPLPLYTVCFAAMLFLLLLNFSLKLSVVWKWASCDF